MSIDLGQPKQRAWRNWQATTERTPLEGEAGTPLGVDDFGFVLLRAGYLL